MRLVTGHLLALLIAASYLTLGIFTPDVAQSVWWAYGLLSFGLAVVNYTMTRSTHGHRGRY